MTAKDDLVSQMRGLYPQVWKWLQAIPGVCGLGVGLLNNEFGLPMRVGWRIYISDTGTIFKHNWSDFIPSQILGFPTAVVHKRISSLCYGNSTEKTLKPGIQIARKTLADEPGTLGCFARVVGEPNKIVLLSNHHVLYGKSSGAGTEIGQPSVSCCLCCACRIIAKNRGDGQNGFNKVEVQVSHPSFPADELWDGSEIDCGAALLNSKRPFTNESEFYGMISGSPPPGTLGVNGGDTVEKVGSSTGLTRGKILQFNTHAVYYPDLTVTIPNILFPRSMLPPGASLMGTKQLINQFIVVPDRDMDFGDEGDSGAIVVNSAKQVIGMLTFVIRVSNETLKQFNPIATTPIPPDSGALGVVSPIGPILKALGVEIVNKMAGTVTTAGPVLEVPPDDVLEQIEKDLAMEATLRDLEREVRQKTLGREILDKIAEHRAEVAALVDHKRAVKVAWHRGQGPAYAAHCFHSFEDHRYKIPSEMDGVTPVELIKRMAHILKVHGNEQLRKDVERYEALALEWIAGCNSVWQLVDRMRTLELDENANEP